MIIFHMFLFSDEFIYFIYSVDILILIESRRFVELGNPVVSLTVIWYHPSFIHVGGSHYMKSSG